MLCVCVESKQGGSGPFPAASQWPSVRVQRVLWQFCSCAERCHTVPAFAPLPIPARIYQDFAPKRLLTIAICFSNSLKGGGALLKPANWHGSGFPVRLHFGDAYLFKQISLVRDELNSWPILLTTVFATCGLLQVATCPVCSCAILRNDHPLWSKNLKAFEPAPREIRPFADGDT